MLPQATGFERLLGSPRAMLGVGGAAGGYSAVACDVALCLVALNGNRGLVA